MVGPQGCVINRHFTTYGFRKFEVLWTRSKTPVCGPGKIELHRAHQSIHLDADSVTQKDGLDYSTASLFTRFEMSKMHSKGFSTPSSCGTRDRSETLHEEVMDDIILRHDFLRYDGVKIHFAECGDLEGKLVILVHGWPNFWYIWKNQFKPLCRAGFHVIAPDLRGYNVSSKSDRLEFYVRSTVITDIEQLIKQFGNGKPAVLVGHDWGATISWCFAEDHPNLVEKLVTVNMGRLDNFSKIIGSNYQQLRRSWYIGFFQIPYLPEFIISLNNCMALRELLKKYIPTLNDDGIKRHAEAFSIPGALTGSLAYYRTVVRGLWNSSGSSSVVKTPVTVIWGDKDQFLLPAVAEPDPRSSPNAKVVHFPQCGHWPMWDDPKSFNEVLLRALAEVSSEE